MPAPIRSPRPATVRRLALALAASVAAGTLPGLELPPRPAAPLYEAGRPDGIPDKLRVAVEQTADPSGWGATVIEPSDLLVIHVDDDALAGAGERGSEGNPFATIAEGLAAAGERLKAGTPVKLLIRNGIYRESNLDIDGAQLGGAARDTLLVIEGEEAGKVFLRGSETEGFEPEQWTLVDEEKRIYRRAWPWNGLPAVDPQRYHPAVEAISRRREMVFVDGTWLRPVLLEDYRHETEKRKRKGGGRRDLIVTDIYLGYRDPLDTLAPGQFGVADLGPGEPDYQGHADPNSIFLRLPEGVEELADTTVEITRRGGRGIDLANKDRVVLRNLVVEHYGLAGIRAKGCRQVVVEDCLIRHNDGGDCACAFRLLECEGVTIRRTISTANGTFGAHLHVWNAVIEDCEFTSNNWRGGLSGHVMHGVGGVSVKGQAQLFRNCRFDRNAGTGMRQDVHGDHVIFEGCSFDGNRFGSGAFAEIALGPIRFSDCTMIGNDHYGLFVLCSHNVLVEDSVLADNQEFQIKLFPMSDRGTAIYPDGFASKTEAAIAGIQHFRLRDSVLSTTRGPMSKLIHWRWWSGSEQDYRDSLATVQLSGNTYWNADSTEVFGGENRTAEEGTYQDLAGWQRLSGQDQDSVWSRPQAIPEVATDPLFGTGGGSGADSWE